MKPTSILFFTLILGLPVVQAILDWNRTGHIQALEVFGPIEEARLRKFENDLREASLIHTDIAPWLQLALTRTLDRGNEKAVVGAGGTLHLATDLESISGGSYLARSHNPVDAIVDFKEQLDERGVELVLLPTPEKTAVMPQMFSMSIEATQAPNPDTRAFYEQLAEAGVNFIDLFELYKTLPEPLYLQRDTHWTPATMERVATEVAGRIRELVEIPATRSWTTESEKFLASGDLSGMLRYPAGHSPFRLMEVESHLVVDANSGEPCSSERDAPILLLGDSFTGAYSDPDLGLGAHAGLAEHIAKELQTTIDVIALPGGASRAVRESLARRKEGLAGKQVVVWQFSMRDLPVASNRWDKVDLGEPIVATATPDQLDVTVEILEVTHIQNFEYAFGLGVFEYRVVQVHSGETDEDTLWVAHVVVQDFKQTEAAAFAVGDRHRLVLEPIEKHYDLEATSWADDTDAGFDIWFPIERTE